MKWNEVTWYSRWGAILLFLVVVPALSFYIGAQYNETSNSLNLINKSYISVGNKTSFSGEQEDSSFKVNPNFVPQYLSIFENFKVIPDAEGDTNPNKDITHLINTNTNSIIYSSKLHEGFSISKISAIPYLALVYSCSQCDAPAEGSILFNSNDGKALILKGEDITKIDIEKGVFYTQKYEYRTKQCPPEQEFCQPDKVIISALLHSLSELK